MKRLLISVLILVNFVTHSSGQQVTWGLSSTRTETRNDAGASGTGYMSGFYQAEPGSAVNYPTGVAFAASWWHMLEVRHDNTAANFAMQFAAPFFDQNLYFRKTQNNGTKPWSRVLLMDANGRIHLKNFNNPNDEDQVNLDVLTKVHTNPYYLSYSLVLNNDLEIKNGAQIVGPGGLAIQPWGPTGSWINFADGNDASGIGSGGIGKDPWIAYAGVGGQWFPNSSHGDICYRNTEGKMLFGNADANAIMAITGNKIGIGTINPSELLSVSGNIVAQKIKVTQSNWSDYVFEPDYKLPSLHEVERHIIKYKHLPNIPSAKQVETDGLDLGGNQATLLRKIEELTLYLIEQNKKLLIQDSSIQKQQREIDLLKASGRRKQ